MDDLRRLYEHQTMMAFGIYSFLDNLLTQIPSRSTASSGSETNADFPVAQRVARVPYAFRNSELAESLLEINRPESFQDRRERIRLLPGLSTGVTPSPRNTGSAMDNVHTPANDGDENLVTEESLLTQSKVEVTPGGYPEEIFIYLSEREKEEFICSVCYCVLKEAYQCKNEHRFCYGCIYTWSTGTSVGHDGCPVCRCDGLYAKNFDLIEKIDRKRARCLDTGCNWMGFLGNYSSHEHRKYTPRELDVLISGTYRQDQDNQPLTIVENSVHGEGEQNELAPADDFPCDERVEAQIVGSLPNACTPLGVAVEHPAIQTTEEVIPLPATRRRAHQSPVHRRSTPRSNTPHRSRLTPHPRVPSRQASTVANGRVTPQMRPPIPPRVSRHSSRQSPVQTNDTHRAGRVRTSSRRESGSRRTPGLTTPENHVALENLHSGPGVRDENRLLPLRTTYELETANTSASAQQPAFSTEPLSTVERHALTGRCGVQEGIQMAHVRDESTGENGVYDNRDTNFSLPAINHNVPLIGHQTPQPYYEIETRPEEGNLSRIRPTYSTQSNRPLEFRRLVPRRNRHVTEQLRETREQLAAMLRLMTLELEERRQQVLAAAIATVNRRQLLRTVQESYSPRAAAQNDAEDVLPSNSPECQNNNLQSSLNILRNLPTPEGTAPRCSRRQPLHHLTSRLLDERLRCDESDVRPYHIRQNRNPSDETRLSTASSTDSTPDDQQPRTVLVPRLLSRVRLRSEQRPSFVVVTGRRTLGQLLAEFRYPRAQVNQWSSDDDVDDDDMGDLL